MASIESRKFETEDIESALELLLRESEETTPAEVMKLLGIRAGGSNTRYVIEVAKFMEYRVEMTGKGWRIYDW